eukprot:6867849-Prymnesium_polylepis.1
MPPKAIDAAASNAQTRRIERESCRNQQLCTAYSEEPPAESGQFGKACLAAQCHRDCDSQQRAKFK